MIQKNVALKSGTGGNVAGAINYLLGEKDHAGELRHGVEVLDGDAQSMIEIEQTMTAKQTYHSSVLAFTPEEMKELDADPSKLDEILTSYKDELATALGDNSGSRLAHYIVMHREADGGSDIHILSMKKDLQTGKHYEPFNSNRGDIIRLNAWNQIEVHKHGLENPNDIKHQRTGSYKHNLPRLAPASLGMTVKEVREQIDAYVESGEFSNRKEVIAALNKVDGISVQPNRSTKSISIKVEGYKKNIRLSGAFYAVTFKGAESVAAAAEARAEQPIETFQSLHAELTAKLQNEYGCRFNKNDQDLYGRRSSTLDSDSRHELHAVQQSEQQSTNSVYPDERDTRKQSGKSASPYHGSGTNREKETHSTSNERGQSDNSRGEGREPEHDTERDAIRTAFTEPNLPHKRPELGGLRGDDDGNHSEREKASLSAGRTLNSIKTTEDGTYFWQVANNPSAWACRERPDGSIAVRGSSSSWKVAAALAVKKDWQAVEIKTGGDPKTAILEHLKLGVDVTRCNDLTTEELNIIKQEINNDLEQSKHINNDSFNRRATAGEARATEARATTEKLADANKQLRAVAHQLGTANARMREAGHDRDKRIEWYYSHSADRTSITSIRKEIADAQARRANNKPLCQRDYDISETPITELITKRQATVEAELKRRENDGKRREEFRSTPTAELEDEAAELQTAIDDFIQVSQQIEEKAKADVQRTDQQTTGTKAQAAAAVVMKQFTQANEQREKTKEEHSIGMRLELKAPTL